MTLQNHTANTELLISRIRKICHPLPPQPTGIPEKLAPLHDIKAILFDVYGTLFTSASGDIGGLLSENGAVALEAALADAGYRLEKTETGERAFQLFTVAIEDFHSKRQREGIEYPEVEILAIWEGVISLLKEEGYIRGEVTLFSLMRLAVEFEFRVNPVWPMPELLETVSALRKKGLVLGIVSNAQFYTPLMFRALAGGAPEQLGFEPSLCVWSYQALEAKPSVRLFKKAADLIKQKFHISNNQVLYVGNDLLKDIWPAGQVGFRTALFAGDKRSCRLRAESPHCAGLQADLIITNLMQLTRISINAL